MLIPTTPPTARLEFLPEDTIAVAAEIESREVIAFRAWVPGFEMDLAETSREDEEGFIDNNCDGCEYYFETTQLDSRDLDALGGLPDWAGEVTEATVVSACPCYSNGLSNVNFPCRAGHDGPLDGPCGGDYYDGPPMLFEITFARGNLTRRAARIPIKTRAFAQAAFLKRDGEHLSLYVAGNDRNLNTHSGGEICWGNNTEPCDLASLVEAYAGSTFNDDLMNYAQFLEVSVRVKRLARTLPETIGAGGHRRHGEYVDGLCDAMLAVDPLHDQAAYGLLAAMGAKPQRDGLIVLPLVWQDFRSEGTLLSPPLPCGVSVLVRPEAGGTGMVIGQAPCFSTISPSPVPSLQLAHA
jgi:hypothetical protein